MAGDHARALSFGTVAQDYDRLRPPPAADAVDWLVPDGCDVAVDVAAGTGLFTRALAGRVARVIAVEPDERMRSVLAERTPGVQVLAGQGEDLPLPDASADLVVVASAWHWLDPQRAIPEIARVLRDGGRWGLIWTTRDRQEWLRGLDLERLGVHRDLPGHRRPETRHREVQLPPDAPFHGSEIASFAFTRPMTKSDVVALLGTYSPVIAADAATRERVMRAARESVDSRFPATDELELPVSSYCWRATRIPREA